MYYRSAYYVCDDSTAIMAYNDMGECECSVTINLSDYGLKPKNNNYIYIPYYKIAIYNMDILNRIITDLVEKIIDEVFIGYNDSCKCLYAKLKSNWKDMCDNVD